MAAKQTASPKKLLMIHHSHADIGYTDPHRAIGHVRDTSLDLLCFRMGEEKA